MTDVDAILPLSKIERKLLMAALEEAIDYWGTVLDDDDIPLPRGMSRKKVEALRLAAYLLYQRIEKLPKLKKLNG